MKKDRGFVAISAIWYERFLECSRTCKTFEFPSSVWRFYHSLLNLDDGELAIKDKVDTYLEKVWRPRINKIVRYNTRDTNDLDTIGTERRFTEENYIHELFYFIIQTIQDSGIGWETYGDMQGFQLKQD